PGRRPCSSEKNRSWAKGGGGGGEKSCERGTIGSGALSASDSVKTRSLGSSMTGFPKPSVDMVKHSVSSMGQFFTRERFGKPQVYAALLLLVFCAQCIWLVNRSAGLPFSSELARIET